MDERIGHLKAAVDALEYQIKRLAVQANLYEKYELQGGQKDYLRRERAKKALEYFKAELTK